MDDMAKSYLAQCTAANHPEIPVRLLYEKWAVYVHDDRIRYKVLHREFVWDPLSIVVAAR